MPTQTLENGFRPSLPEQHSPPDQNLSVNTGESRSQPWRAHWPAKATGVTPDENGADTKGIHYGFEKGEKVVIYGT